MPRIYLDYNATAPLMPAVREAMLEAFALPSNPSSVHTEGRAARALMERCRRTLAEALGAFPDELIFTSGGTEANGLALAQAAGRALAVGATEHPSVTANAPGADVLPVDGQGLIDRDRLVAWLKVHPGAFVSVQLANNETGVIQPIAEIAAMVHAHDGLLHVDAAQGFGRIPVDMGLLGADYLTLCAHKCGGPVGIGALVAHAKAPLAPILRGGRQEQGRRAGTQAVALIAGFAAAVDTHSLQPLRGWLDAFESQARVLGGVVMGADAPRLPNVSCIAMPDLPAETQVMAFDLAGIAVSAGAACASGKVGRSLVLDAMKAGDLAGQAVRFSGGWATVESNICESFATWRKLYEKARSALDNVDAA